jgi:hypothetical protein
MQLPRADLALSLFSFNLGVEIGQIVFVVLLFPLIDDLIRSGWTKLRPAVSIAISGLLAALFIQRAFLASEATEPAWGHAVAATARATFRSKAMVW